MLQLIQICAMLREYKAFLKYVAYICLAIYCFIPYFDIDYHVANR